MGDASGRHQQEGEKDERDDAGRHPEADERLAAPAATPDIGRRERDEHRRIELHGDRRAEHAEAEPVAAMDERGERADDQGGRVEVEAREDDRTEQEREAGDESERGSRPAARGTQPRQRDGGEQHSRDAARRHQPLEDVAEALVVVAQERRQGERGERSGRVLRLDVPVGHRAGLDRVPVRLVDRDVDDLVARRTRPCGAAPQETRNSATASAAATSVNRRDAGTGATSTAKATKGKNQGM